MKPSLTAGHFYTCASDRGRLGVQLTAGDGCNFHSHRSRVLLNAPSMNDRGAALLRLSRL